MGAAVAWDGGGEATVTALADDRIELASSRPFPPGSRPEGALASGARVRIKVHGSRRTGETFEVRGRLIDATRDLRAAIAETLSTRPENP